MRTPPKVPGIGGQPMTMAQSIGHTPNRVSVKDRHPAYDKRKSARSARPFGGNAVTGRILPEEGVITWTSLRRACRAHGISVLRDGNTAILGSGASVERVTIG